MQYITNIKYFLGEQKLQNLEAQEDISIKKRESIRLNLA